MPIVSDGIVPANFTGENELALRGRSVPHEPSPGKNPTGLLG